MNKKCSECAHGENDIEADFYIEGVYHESRRFFRKNVCQSHYDMLCDDAEIRVERRLEVEGHE